MYCLDCMGNALCSYCLTPHKDHHIIQVGLSSPSICRSISMKIFFCSDFFFFFLFDGCFRSVDLLIMMWLGCLKFRNSLTSHAYKPTLSIVRRSFSSMKGHSQGLEKESPIHARFVAGASPIPFGSARSDARWSSKQYPFLNSLDFITFSPLLLFPVFCWQHTSYQAFFSLFLFGNLFWWMGL